MANPYGFMDATSPFNLEVIRVLAGVANAEKVTDDVRKLANENLQSILQGMSKEIKSLSVENSEILNV